VHRVRASYIFLWLSMISTEAGREDMLQDMFNMDQD
jgi:hypothetical protein